MASEDNPEQIILATQRALCDAMLGVIDDLRVSHKAPGLTWDQIEFMIKGYRDKMPEIVRQEHDL